MQSIELSRGTETRLAMTPEDGASPPRVGKHTGEVAEGRGRAARAAEHASKRILT